MPTDGDGSLEGKYIPSGTTIPGVDVSDVTLTAASGESVDLPGLGTVECASDDGCSGTVADGVLTITGDLKIVSVDPALDTETATVLAGLAVDMLPEPDVDMLPDEPDPAIAQREAISNAIATARTAVAAVNDDSTDAQVEAATQAIAGCQSGDRVGDRCSGRRERREHRDGRRDHGPARHGQDSPRMVAMEAADDEQRMADAAMAATAAKLYVGISMPAGEATATAMGTRFAQYAPDAGDIVVRIDDAGDVFLSEDKKTMVAANHGWEGKRYTRTTPAGGGTYEAVVFSNVEAMKEGRKFGSAAVVADTGAFEYMLTEGAYAITENVEARVAITGVTRTAGTETFHLPDPNPSEAGVINIPGSFHGVSGTYNCTPTTPTAGCSASVAATGFTLGGGDWTFTPRDANARVMSAADTAYASYGWWLHKRANDGSFTASAFVDEKGTVAPASGLDELNGTATYMGGAAGKYALSSSTGGTNDAGHFTARATLQADFTNNTVATAISGTLDNFMGADDQPRDWEVKLGGSVITDAGVIGNPDANDGTVWTIGGTDADASGQWSGSLRNNGTDDVPQVTTGTFYSEYGTAGKMVGGFGATKQ